MTTYTLIVEVKDFSHVETALPDQLLTLEEATWLPELGAQFSEKQLWGAIDGGHLSASKIGRMLYVTRGGIVAWLEKARVVRRRPVQPSGASAGPSKSLASQAAARQVLASLRAVKR